MSLKASYWLILLAEQWLITTWNNKDFGVLNKAQSA